MNLTSKKARGGEEEVPHVGRNGARELANVDGDDPNIRQNHDCALESTAANGRLTETADAVRPPGSGQDANPVLKVELVDEGLAVDDNLPRHQRQTLLGHGGYARVVHNRAADGFPA